MKPTLYFLRSSEQRIATDMLYYAARLDDLQMSLDEFPHLDIYERYYGLNQQDVGLYALVGHEVAGAAWIRLLKASNGADAYLDDDTPVLTIAVKPEFRRTGIATAMLEQLLLEAGALYERLSVSVVHDSPAIALFERFGLSRVDGSEKLSPIDGSRLFTMLKELPKKEVTRPSDGYDPTYWMD